MLLLYYPLLSILYLISLLPFRVLYIISDFLYFVLFYVLKYRRNVVTMNLANAFPQKSVEEREVIAKKYYHNLCDSIVETIKLLSISKKQLSKRITCNWDILDTLTLYNRNAQAMISHQFNWEWVSVMNAWMLPRTFVGLYMPLTSNVFEKLMKKIRSRSGTVLLRVQDMQKEMAQKQSQKIMWGFIADQNPSDPKRVSWNDFFHRKTAFFKGPEFVARRYNNLVYFADVKKIKRGYYHINAKLAFDDAQHTQEGEITEAYVRHLEHSIKCQPDNWVWSHRRWKHQFTH